MFSSVLVSAFLAASTLVQASPVTRRGYSDGDGFISGFLTWLDGLELSESGDVWRRALESEEGGYLAGVLQSQTVTVLIPENSAYDSKYSNYDDPLDLLSYSTVYGSPEDDFKINNGSYTRRGARQSRSSASSGLRWPRRTKRAYGLLDNNQVQIIDQFSSSGKKRWNDGPSIIIDRPVDSARVVARSSYKNVIICIIDKVLTLPEKVSDLLWKPLVSSAPYGFAKFGGGLQKAGLLDYVDNGFKSTVFVPTDQAFYDSDCDDDHTPGVLKNHFFFGEVVYSTIFRNVPKVTAESGKELRLSYEDGVHYVRCGQSKAIILRSDVTSKFGVLHVIDKVLKCD
ncbi:hypothetical protein FRC08_012817 [Ceratobasidium sp. 394]|nr:hypothetical protein FRC08_012817 [Ceratobasidium sp. 394]